MKRNSGIVRWFHIFKCSPYSVLHLVLDSVFYTISLCCFVKICDIASLHEVQCKLWLLNLSSNYHNFPNFPFLALTGALYIMMWLTEHLNTTNIISQSVPTGHVPKSCDIVLSCHCIEMQDARQDKTNCQITAFQVLSYFCCPVLLCFITLVCLLDTLLHIVFYIL